MTLTICDTNALIFWSQAPDRLSAKALQHLECGIERGSLACSDISLWEIAMLFAGGRLVKPIAPAQFMRDVVSAMNLAIFPITPEIAVLSQAQQCPVNDPADRIIGATSLHHHAPLITSDRRLRAWDALETVW